MYLVAMELAAVVETILSVTLTSNLDFILRF